MRRRTRASLLWTRSDLGAVILLLLVAAVFAAHAALQPRIGFIDEPPTLPERVALAVDRIDPNTASRASLIRLHGIGPGRAQGIIDYRTARGPGAFKTAGDLMKVKGVGPATVSRIAPELSLPE